MISTSKSCSEIFQSSGSLLSRLVAEMTEVTGMTDQMLEDQLGSSLAVARAKIDYGQKDQNPVVSLVVISQCQHLFSQSQSIADLHVVL